MAVFSIVTTGTTYAIPATGSFEAKLTAVNRTTEARYGTFAGCPLCGSPNWAFGSAPDLLR